MQLSTRRSHIPLSCLAIAAALASPASAQDAKYPGPPPASDVCPAIEEDGMLCAADPWSGNCADFVVTADKLGALYRSELKKLPDSANALKTTIWWGCGSATLYDVKRLLVGIGTDRARAVLATEPYASLPPVEMPVPSMESAPAPLSCVDLTRPVERNTCMGVKLQAARTAHKTALDRCKGVLPEAMREQLVAEESSFQATLPARCDAAADQDGAGASLQAFNRSRCLADALAERDRGMFEAFPQCAAR